MTTDNRTNEPTPEQIEAAAQAVREVDARAGLIADVDLPMYRARAALAAAAGAAPQAESVPTSKYISPHLPSMIRNLWKSDPSENSVRTALKLAGDLIQELIDLRAANMLREPGVPDAATEELARIKPLFENYSREYPNECNKRVKAEAERDAALAALERVRALETFSITDSYPAWTAVDHDDLLAALDGAPEPEVITIPRPVVPFGPVSKTENEATADYLLEVVKKINGKYCTVGGSNVTAAVRKLLTDAADAVRGLPVEGESE